MTTASAPALVQLTQNFVASLSPAYASAAFLQQTLQLGFDDGAGAITVGGFIADGGKAGFVKQGAPIPVHSRLVTPCMLEPSTIKTISTMTVEMVTGSNAQALIEDVLRQDVGLALDGALFDANPAVAETRPAGLRHGIAPLTASAATDPTDAMLADIATVAGGVAPVAGNSPITLVANPVRAMMLKLRAPRDLPVTVLASSSIAPADLVALAPSAVVSRDGRCPGNQRREGNSRASGRCADQYRHGGIAERRGGSDNLDLSNRRSRPEMQDAGFMVATG